MPASRGSGRRKYGTTTVAGMHTHPRCREAAKECRIAQCRILMPAASPTRFLGDSGARDAKPSPPALPDTSGACRSEHPGTSHCMAA